MGINSSLATTQNLVLTETLTLDVNKLAHCRAMLSQLAEITSLEAGLLHTVMLGMQ